MSLTYEQLRDRYGSRYKWLVLLTVMIGTIASILSSTIVNVAIPDLSRHFSVGQERAQWVSAGFMLAMTLSMLTTPWLLLRFGLRRTFTAAIPMLLAMRVLEGLAAGIVQPIPAIVILRAFDKEEQGKAMGIFGFGVVLAPAVGPSVSGFLVEQFGWRAIFFVVVPFCVVVLLMMIRRLLAVNSPLMGDARRLDWKGLLLAGVSTTSLLNGFVHLRGDPHQAIALLALGLASFAAFIGYQLRTAEPLVNMRLFGYRQFAMGSLVAFIYGMGLFGSTYLLPVYMQIGLRFAPSQAGLVLLPAGIVLAVTIPLAGRLVDAVAPNLLVTAGLSLLALSFALMATGTPGSGFAALTAWAVIGRIGLGFVLPALNLGAMRGLETDLIAQGASAINFVRQLGGAIGVSLVGIVLEWRLAAHGISTSGSAAGGDAIARIRAFDETFLLVAALCAIAVAAAWRMRARPTD